MKWPDYSTRSYYHYSQDNSQEYGQTVDLGPAALSQDDFTSTNTLDNCEDNTYVA